MKVSLPPPAHQAPRYASDDARWRAVAARDSGADGRFCFAVITTGIYCRPGCPARMPKRENVRFFATGAAAELAGFRPCKRCRPDAPASGDRHALLIEQACRHIEQAPALPSLDALAQGAGLSRFHFHRLFKAITGVTPRAYAAAHRSHTASVALGKGRKVTDALYDAGFGSKTAFYADAAQRLGMPPAQYRRGGAGENLHYAFGECSLGHVLVASSSRGICAILLGDDRAALVQDLHRRFSRAEMSSANPDFSERIAQVIAMIDNPERKTKLPLDIRGTAFQQRVWQALRDIPPGNTTSYAALTKAIGLPARNVRAVAQAIAANPLAIAVPCHRVVRSDGGLAGYRWGVERKQALLEREAGVKRKATPAQKKNADKIR